MWGLMENCSEQAVFLNLVYFNNASTFGSTDPISSTKDDNKNHRIFMCEWTGITFPFRTFAPKIEMVPPLPLPLFNWKSDIWHYRLSIFFCSNFDTVFFFFLARTWRWSKTNISWRELLMKLVFFHSHNTPPSSWQRKISQWQNMNCSS